MQLEEIVAFREGEEEALEVLVKWKGMPLCENSCKSLQKMGNYFPVLHLVDKVKILGDGVDMNISLKEKG